MDLYGLIGYPLEHSYSPEYYNRYFQGHGIAATYRGFEMETLKALPQFLQNHPQLKGFNVTIPHKEKILPYLDHLSEEARAIGAVNCVKIEHHANCPKLIGYNTDAYGFRTALQNFIPTRCQQALILGNGGAAKAVRYVLDTLHISFQTVSRTPQSSWEISYEQSKHYLSDCLLIINTTPLGTWPHTATYPDIAYDLLTPNHYLFDLVYNPATTSFMKQGQKRGAHTCNGLLMLLKQAEKNLEIWKNKNNSLFSQSIS